MDKLLESPELLASARNFQPPDLPACPEPPAPGVQTSPERANSLDSPEPGRNLLGTSGARNFRPCPELPACLRAKTQAEAHVSLSHLPVRGLDYIYFSIFTSLGLAL